MSKEIKIDSLVRIELKEGEKDLSKGMLKYNRFVTRVVGKRDKGAYGTMYELRGCLSDKGVPYTFTDDYLKLIK